MGWAAVRWVLAYLGWVALVYVVLWHAASPNLEQPARIAAEATAVALKTQIAQYVTPTPVCFYHYSGYGYGCR